MSGFDEPWTAMSERPVVVVPVGSTEQHGPHLPLDTDTRIAVALATTLSARRPHIVVTAPIAITASGEHAGFPGTLSIGTDVLVSVLVEITRSADWASDIVFVNAHGGNADAVRRAAKVIEDERRRALFWSPRFTDAGTDAHAGRTETSLLLHLAPEVVMLDRAEAGNPAPLADLMAGLRAGGVRRVAPNGVLGDPAGASAAEGAARFERLADDLCAAFDAWVTT
jgi:creatinine amidohydrolase